MTPRARAVARFVLRVGVSGGVLALLFSRFGVRDVLDVCLRARPGPLVAAFALYLASQLASAWRWQVAVRRVGFDASWLRCARIYLMGMFFGLVVPSTLGSDAVRALALGTRPPGRSRALSSVVFDRAIGLATLIAIAAVALVFGPHDGLPAWVTFATLGGTGLIVGFLAGAPLVAKLLPREMRLRRIASDQIGPYLRDRPLLVQTSAISLFVHALQIASQLELTDALALDLPVAFAAVYHPLAALAAAIPITIGGFGLREAVYAYLLPFAGVAPNDAVALGLLWWGIGALGALLGGVVYALSPESRQGLLRRRRDPVALT